MLRDLLILRDPKESWRRCSLAPLRGREGVRFVAWREGLELDVEGRLLLDPDAPVLTPADIAACRTTRDGQSVPVRLFLLDSSWRRLSVVRGAVVGRPIARRLPVLRTAYPRRSQTFQDPAQGLASIEALFAVTCMSGSPDFELLDGYHFKDAFLAQNPGLFESCDVALPLDHDRR